MAEVELRPVTKAEADGFICAHHRHHGVPVGALWWQGAHNAAGDLVGVVVIGRPVARGGRHPRRGEGAERWLKTQKSSGPMPP